MLMELLKNNLRFLKPLQLQIQILVCTFLNYIAIELNLQIMLILQDPEIFDWKFENYRRTTEDEELMFETISQHRSDLVIHEFLIKNVNQ